MITQVKVDNFKQFPVLTSFDLNPKGITFLAGGNNSGKSSLLQALAVWEFCRAVLEQERGDQALRAGYRGAGIGIRAEDFSPVAVPDFTYLWHNLKATTPLKIRCAWLDFDEETPSSRELEFTLKLHSDRLTLKPSISTVPRDRPIPRVAYLPPFAGITAREERMSAAARRRLIGRGVAGAVLRNLLYDLWEKSGKEHENLRDSRRRIAPRLLAEFRAGDPWERLVDTVYEVFKIGLTVDRFNELYHTTLQVARRDGKLEGGRFRVTRRMPPRDIMTEGSGFLQWLSVYALAVDPDIQILLLDEPDAHLHPELQGHLTFKLNQLALQTKKQVLVATHSTTILSEQSAGVIYRMDERDRGYLCSDNDRVRLFVGLGSAYAPRLDRLKRFRRLLLHDGPSDLALLRIWMRKLGHLWPENLVPWGYTKDHEARRILYAELKEEIPELECLSLQDRDDYPLGEIQHNLTFVGNRMNPRLRMWKRRNIENYLLVPSAIARASGHSPEDVTQYLIDKHAIAIPSLTDFTRHDCVQTLANTDGKKIISTEAESVCNCLNVTIEAIAEAMELDEIAEDVKTLSSQILDLCR